MSEEKYKRIELGKYIVADPHICHGQPIFRGTRVIVPPVIKSLSGGKTIDEIAADYQIPDEAVIEALYLAAEALLEKYAVPFPEPIIPTEELVKMSHAEYRALWPKEKYKRVEISKHIVADPFICHGKPTARGTRVLMHIVIKHFSTEETIDEIASGYQILRETVVEALNLAAEALLEEYTVPYPELLPTDELLELNPTDSRVS